MVVSVYSFCLFYFIFSIIIMYFFNHYINLQINKKDVDGLPEAVTCPLCRL